MKMREKDVAFVRYQNSSKSQNETNAFNELVDQLTEQVKDAKYDYYSDISNKLNNPLACKKKYWSIIKTLMNGNKVPLIPPFSVGNQFIIDFKEKAEALNFFFSGQCKSIENDKRLPSVIDIVTDQTLQDVFYH